MEKFNRGQRGGGFSGGRAGAPRYGGSGRPDRFSKPFRGNKFEGNRGGGDRGPVFMHDAICSDCSKKCQVPFKPMSGKPIFCNDCFGGKRGSDERPERREFNDRPTPRFTPEKPTENLGDLKRQIDALHVKIDSLVRVVESSLKTKSAPAPVTIVKIPKTPVKKVVKKASAKKKK